MMNPPFSNRSSLALAAFVVLTFTSTAYPADIGYVTGGTTIYAWDTGTNLVTPVTTSTTGGSLDSLIFDLSGNLLYSIIGSNAIGKYNLTTHSNVVLSSGGNFSGVADMTLDPGGATFLVSNAFGNSIDRVSDTTGATSTLYSGLRPDGLAYDNSGHLFAVLNEGEVAQLNPTTGAIINTISTPNQADGLTFDAATGKLYVSSDGGGFYTVNTSLTSAIFTPVAGSPVFDGIASDGNLLFFVVRGTNAVQYNLTSGVTTLMSPGIAGADDIAPVAGLGSNPTPEPASFLLFGAGMLGIGFMFRRRFVQ